MVVSLVFLVSFWMLMVGSVGFILGIVLVGLSAWPRTVLLIVAVFVSLVSCLMRGVLLMFRDLILLGSGILLGFVLFFSLSVDDVSIESFESALDGVVRGDYVYIDGNTTFSEFQSYYVSYYPMSKGLVLSVLGGVCG